MNDIMDRATLDQMAAQLDSTVPYYLPALIASHQAALDKIEELRNLLRILGEQVTR